ncbi:hypothetical protein MRB53_026263 [Persea americana]|uniref:Uncharacterized protein n=1 Tax=Persea americana TaxID=3435 RepID=A0ACC2LIN8_PERAE|nr:hypothetical protein MRB53_026263 [Persea americana]
MVEEVDFASLWRFSHQRRGDEFRGVEEEHTWNFITSGRGKWIGHWRYCSVGDELMKVCAGHWVWDLGDQRMWGKGKSGFLSHRFEKGGSAAALRVAVADVLWLDRKHTHLRPSPEKGTSATIATPGLRVAEGAACTVATEEKAEVLLPEVKGKNSVLLQNRTLERKEETNYKKKKKRSPCFCAFSCICLV